MRLFRLLSIVLMLLTSVQLHAAISSQIDRNVVEQGQTFLLMLSFTQNDLRGVDLSPLEEDFEIISRSHQSGTSIINGELKTSTKLIITLAPKRAGKLEVPAVSLNSQQSQSHEIEVKPVKQLSAVDGGVELLSTLSDSEPRVQQPIIYQMNLVLGQRIYNASFQEPTIKQGKALIQPLGEQRQYRQTLNGREMLVVEQSWLIIPQQSGALNIEGAKLSAEIRNVNGSIDPFRRMNDPRAVRRIYLSADSYTVEVTPIPKSFSGRDWIAATDLSLKSEMSSDDWKVGEPVTRIITLQAKGIGQDQLPEIVLPSLLGIKQYAAKPVYEQDQKNNELGVTMTQEITIIPSQQGEVILPEVKLPWWNTETNKEEVAILPKQAINVLPSDLGNFTESTEHSPNTLKANTPIEEIAPSSVQNKQSITPVSPSQLSADYPATKEWAASYRSWILIFVMVVVGGILGSIITILFYKRSRSSVGDSTLHNAQQNSSVSRSLNTLQKACKSNDPHRARDALLTWGRVALDCKHLNSLQQKLPSDVRDLINELNSCCYDKARRDWKGDKLWRAIQGYDLKGGKCKLDHLEPLVPRMGC